MLDSEVDHERYRAQWLAYAGAEQDVSQRAIDKRARTFRLKVGKEASCGRGVRGRVLEFGEQLHQHAVLCVARSAIYPLLTRELTACGPLAIVERTRL